MPDDERPKLRLVGGDPPDDEGSLPVVLEDLDVAHGHVVEATAELDAVAVDAVDPTTKRSLLRQMETVRHGIEAVQRAIRPWIP